MKRSVTKKLPQLSPKELAYIKLICNEYTTKEIAEKYGISPRTMEDRRRFLFNKLRVKTSLGLLKYAVKKGLYTIK